MQPEDWIVHPYFLKEYNNRWFLMGMYETTKTLGTYALDRMLTVKVSSLKYEENQTLDAEAHFKDIVGVTFPSNASMEIIELEFSQKRAPYVVTKPIHHSQKTITTKDSGEIVIQLNLIPNPEFESIILGFGCDVEVLKPETLKKKIQLVIEKMRDCYQRT